MEKTEQAVGIYSAKAAELYGTSIYLGADGKEHEVSAIDKPSKYKWDDAVILGPMGKWLRKGRKGNAPGYER
jgi:hypothetical protein